jgi:hypothetical protein
MRARVDHILCAVWCFRVTRVLLHLLHECFTSNLRSSVFFSRRAAMLTPHICPQVPKPGTGAPIARGAGRCRRSVEGVGPHRHRLLSPGHAEVRAQRDVQRRLQQHGGRRECTSLPCACVGGRCGIGRVFRRHWTRAARDDQGQSADIAAWDVSNKVSGVYVTL